METRTEELATGQIGYVEVHRAVRRHIADHPEGDAGKLLGEAQTVLERFDLVPADAWVIERAATFEHPKLRALDALHLATALSFGGSLSIIVAYDPRLKAAAEAVGQSIVEPGR